jgi:NADH:ubiquinone oxidoreductase subunit D
MIIFDRHFNYELLIINFGPQHPATHGVLRCISIFHGEIIQYLITEIGLLHRGTEKLIETNENQEASIPYFARLDYVSTVTQELLFIQTLELMISCYTSSVVSL